MKAKKITYHYCTMTQISGFLSYSDGFITFESFDPSLEGTYYKVRMELAKAGKIDEEKMVVLSLSIVGENP